MITYVWHYLFHLNNHKIGMQKILEHLSFVFTDRGGILFYIEGEYGPVSIWKDEVMNCPDKKHFVSIGYLCGHMVSEDVISFPDIRFECIKILALIQVLPQTSLKIGVFFPLNKKWPAALFEFLAAVAWAWNIGSGIMIYIIDNIGCFRLSIDGFFNFIKI